MKFSLEWHLDCLKNHRASLQRYENELKVLTERTNQTKTEIEWYEKQIETAIKEHKPYFDREKYLLKRGK